MPLNLGVNHTFLKTIVYLGLLEIGYSSEVNTGADAVSAFPVLERLGTLGGESRPPGWGGSSRGGTAAGQSEGEVAPGFASEGLAVESWEAQSLAWSAAAEAAPQARSVPPGAWTPRSARARLLTAPCTQPPRAHDLPSRTKGAASLPSPA